MKEEHGDQTMGGNWENPVNRHELYCSSGTCSHKRQNQ
jgi:hypothetical protein